MSSSNFGSSSGGNGGGGGPCGACKFLRRKCVAGCVFAPYFDSDEGAGRFAAVHKVFGASNVSKLLLNIPVHKRPDAVVTVCYEAQARLRDPVYGCVAHIFALQQQVVNLQAELSYLQAHLATLELPTPPPAPPQTPPLLTPPPLSMANLPTSSAIPTTYDLSSLFDPIAQPSSWPPHPHFSIAAAVTAPLESSSTAAAGDLQEVARELLTRRAPPRGECRNQVSDLPPHSS